MRLTVRRRAALAALLTCPIGFAYVFVAGTLATEVLRQWRSGFVGCGNGTLKLLQEFNGCNTGYSATGALLEIAALTAVLAVYVVLLARWVTWPIRAMRDSVEQLGPNSLGLRIRARGPLDETRRLADAIDTMLDRLAEGYEAQRRFAANASHELRTPLATQRALIEISLARALTPEQLELLAAQLLATNERNERLVDGLLTLAETEQGLLANGPQRLDLIAAASVDNLRAAAKEREVELVVLLAPTAVFGEAPLLERLCSNLVQNAIKYNVPGGVVRVEVRPDATLLVTNTGATVAPELVPTLFEPFRRATGDRLDHGGGVGLGLTIARSIVAAHSGSISATANPDGGLTVEVRLRRA